MDIKIQLTSLTDHHKRLSNNQHGFREQRTIETAISQYHKEIASRVDEGNYVIELSFDISRDF